MRSWPRPARRRVAATLAALAMSIPVTACGGSSSSGADGSRGATSTGAPVTTTVATATGSSTTPASRASRASGSSSADGLKVFTSAGCGACHTLAAAHANGNVGPNLDDLRPPESLIVAQVTDGGAAMPSFAGKLSRAQIEAVAKFVASAAG